MIRTFVAVLAFLLAACPHNGPGPEGPGKDPYAIGRTVVQGAQLTLVGADGVFEICASFMEAQKATETRQQYLRIRASVVEGLHLALTGIDIAESQKAGFDILKLMAHAESAYQDLLKFLASIRGETPSSRSAFSTKHRAPSPDDLPKTLLPAN